jgi:hypothetical protein
MNQFSTARDAKEYLIDRIVAQANQDGIPLTDVERKMLYFSETGWTLPDMKTINREFDEAYDQNEYESKIGQIARRIHERSHDNGDDGNWDEAVERLADEDHYLLVLIDSDSNIDGELSRRQTVGLTLAGAATMMAFFLILSLIDLHGTNRSVSRVIGESTILAAILVGVYFAFRKHKSRA